MTQTKLPIPVGFQWSNTETGKQWVVTRLRPGGVCEIHQVGRHVSGESYARDIRMWIESGSAIRIETTDEARKIMRRCAA